MEYAVMPTASLNPITTRLEGGSLRGPLSGSPYFSSKTYVVGTLKNRLNESVLLSTLNKCLNQSIKKYSQFYT